MRKSTLFSCMEYQTARQLNVKCGNFVSTGRDAANQLAATASSYHDVFLNKQDFAQAKNQVIAASNVDSRIKTTDTRLS
jgi:hypothetical protein